jgi:diguanylate cyclase (GGDEF)-like protein
MSEHKVNHRGRTLLAGKVICNSGRSTINCVVRSISDHGATIEVESPFAISEHFNLLIPHEDAALSCKLVWQNGKELGLEFEHADAKDAAAVQLDHPRHRVDSMISRPMLALRSALDQIQVGVLLLDSELRAQFMNRAFRKMWNVPDALADRKPAFVALLHRCGDSNAYQASNFDLDAFIAERARLVSAGDTSPLDLRRANGEVIRVQCSVLPDGGRMLSYTEVTDIIRHSDELEVLRNALDNISDGVVLLDPDLNAQFLNRKMREYFGITDEQAAAHPSYKALIAGAAGAHAEDISHIAAAAVTDDPNVCDLQVPDGRNIRVHSSKMANGGRILTYSDVTDLVRNAAQQEMLATIDSMTGLYNRRHFMVLAEAEWNRFQRYHQPLSLLMIDIDHFKSVNDRFGHAVGDEAIKSFGAACRQIKRDSDIVGRLGGEEFAILLPETFHTQAWILAERLRERVASELLSAHGVEFKLTISIGVAAATPSMSGVEALLQSADQALYQAKSDGRNRTVRWSPPLAPGLVAIRYAGTSSAPPYFGPASPGAMNVTQAKEN